VYWDTRVENLEWRSKWKCRGANLIWPEGIDDEKAKLILKAYTKRYTKETIARSLELKIEDVEYVLSTDNKRSKPHSKYKPY